MHRIDHRHRRRLIADIPHEGCYRDLIALGVREDALGGVLHPAGDPMAQRKVVYERAEPHTLDHARDVQRDSSHALSPR